MQRDMQSKDSSVGPAGAVPDLRVRTVVGVFTDPGAAERTYEALRRAEYAAEDISVVHRGEGVRPEIGVEQTHAGRTTAAGVSAGVVLGGIAGLVALAIPGIGPLLAVGPIAFALTGAGIGGALGGLVGSLVGLGIPDEQARSYEEAVRQGGILLSVRVPDAPAAEAASALLREQGATSVAAYTAAI
jgi:uncharacterized membrane protein